MNNFFDLQNFQQFQIKSSYEFLIYLLDELFGKDSYKDTIKIDLSSETDKNHKLLLDQWDSIHTLYKTPTSIKKTQKLVRQTIKQIVDYLNETHKFTKPIKFDHKRIDFYQKGRGKIAKHWIDLSLN